LVLTEENTSKAAPEKDTFEKKVEGYTKKRGLEKKRVRAREGELSAPPRRREPKNSIEKERKRRKPARRKPTRARGGAHVSGSKSAKRGTR